MAAMTPPFWRLRVLLMSCIFHSDLIIKSKLFHNRQHRCCCCCCSTISSSLLTSLCTTTIPTVVLFNLIPPCVGDLKKKGQNSPSTFYRRFLFLLFDGNFLQPKGKREKMKGLARACTHKVPKNWISSFFFFSRLGWEKNGRTMSIW